MIQSQESEKQGFGKEETIQISVYPGQIYIYNIGEMPAEITPAEKRYKKHPSGTQPQYHWAFFRSGMIESWGRGYDKVVRGP